MSSQQPVRIRLPGVDVADAAEQLTEAVRRSRPGRWRQPGDLRVRVRRDGRVRLSQVPGTFTGYLVLGGRLTADARGRVHLVGTARRSMVEPLVVGVFAFATLTMLGGLAASLANADGIGITVCTAGALGLGALTVALQRARSSFAEEVEQQVAAVRRALRD